jgi:hypothetical protein
VQSQKKLKQKTKKILAWRGKIELPPALAGEIIIE